MTSYDQNRRWLWIAVIIISLLVVIFGGYWVLKRDGGTVSTEKTTPPTGLPRMTNLPSMKTTTPPPPPSYPPDAPVLEQARKALREGLDPAGALALARSLPDRPERADAAFLLLEYAADSGDAEAALEVGRYYDPAYKGPSGSIRKNPAAAYERYQEARAGGEEKAQKQLAELRRWVEGQAAKGSSEAWKMLNRWR